MVTSPTPNQIRNRARRIKPKGGDETHMMLAAQRLGIPEHSLVAAAKWLRNAMVDHMAAHPPRPAPGDCAPSQDAKMWSVGMLLSALGFEPEGVSEEEALFGMRDVGAYDADRAKMQAAGQ